MLDEIQKEELKQMTERILKGEGEDIDISGIAAKYLHVGNLHTYYATFGDSGTYETTVAHKGKLPRDIRSHMREAIVNKKRELHG